MTAEQLATQNKALARATLTADQIERQSYSISILMRAILTKLHDVIVDATLVSAASWWLDGARTEVTEAEEIERVMRKVYVQYIVSGVDPIDNMREIASAATVRVLSVRFHDLAAELSASLKRIA